MAFMRRRSVRCRDASLLNLREYLIFVVYTGSIYRIFLMNFPRAGYACKPMQDIGRFTRVYIVF